MIAEIAFSGCEFLRGQRRIPLAARIKELTPRRVFFERNASLVSISAPPVRLIDKSWAQVDSEPVIIE
jgi:hypothetical protein